ELARANRRRWEPPVIRIGLTVAAAVERQPEGRTLDLEDHVAVGLDVLVPLGALVQRVLVHLEAVHVGYVAGIDAAFHRLKVIAFLQALRDEHVARRQIAPLDRGGRGLLALRSHIGPDDAGALDAWIAFDPHVLAGLRRRRHVDALPVDRKLQTVIGAADAVLLVAAEVKRGAAVRAEFIDEPDLALGVTEGEQLLAENL